MNELTWKYLAFVVAASILIWGVLEINKRLYRRNKTDQDSPSNWINLDANKQEEVEDEEVDDQEESSEDELRIRSKQNGHHSKTTT
jgi:hypothetical protein